VLVLYLGHVSDSHTCIYTSALLPEPERHNFTSIRLLRCLWKVIRLPFCILKEDYYLNPGSYQSDVQGSQLVSEPCPAFFGEPLLALWCFGRGESLCQISRSAGAWWDSSPNEPGMPSPGDKEVKKPSPNPRLVPRNVVMKYHRLELSPSKGSLFSLHRSQYYGTVSLQKQ
jgi:hypothetical protein